MSKTTSTTQGPVAAIKVITGEVRLSYCHVWKPDKMDGEEKAKYSVSVIIPKSDKRTLQKIKAAIEAAKEIGKGKWGGKIPARLQIPIRDGDEERPDDEAYADSYFFNAKSFNKPGVVDRHVQPILDQDEVYSGIYGRVSVNFFAYNASGNKGVAAGLNHIQKLRDGEPLDGRSSAESDFAEFAEDTSTDDLF